MELSLMRNQNKKTLLQGFTLIEVLIALAIMAIALTALLKASSHNIVFTQQLKDKTISHWVGLQAISAIQSNIIPVKSGEVTSHVTNMLNNKWYWQAELKSTKVERIKIIQIKTTSQQDKSQFDTLYAYKFSG